MKDVTDFMRYQQGLILEIARFLERDYPTVFENKPAVMAYFIPWNQFWFEKKEHNDDQKGG